MNKIYEVVTDKIISLLEQNIIPWRKPWDVQFPMNMITGKQYRGINIMLLSYSGYQSPYWLTYKQAQTLKGNVRKGEKGSMVVYWNFVKIQSDNDVEKKIPFMKYYTVFNVEQCEGIPVPEASKIEFNPLTECEAVINNFLNKPLIEHGGNRASYSVKQDLIRMPHKETFNSVQGYYGTLFHEMTHSTGNASRLNRKTITESNGFGSENYSKEELIAEIGASFLCAVAGIENQTIENQANYIKNWLLRLKDDKQMIISASSQAQKATDYILGNVPVEVV